MSEREHRLLARVIELERRLRLAQSGKAKQKARALLWRTRALRSAK